MSGASNNWTLFKSGSTGGGANASDYLKDNFKDTSNPATLNTGFTSNASTNPLDQFFLNDDAPKYSVKTLWVKDLEVLDKSLWISGKPTYQIIFHETFPGAFGYVAGDVRLRNSANGVSVDIRQIDDIGGVTGVIRRVAWLLNTTDQTATADLITDGTDTTNDITYGSAVYASTLTGYNKYTALLHNSSNATKDIHDFRITPNNTLTTSLAGIIVYYENATSDVDLFPGSTYVDKTKQTTSSITTQSLASVSGRLGANTLIYKTTANTYSSATVEPDAIESVGVGSGAATSIDVTTGHGASFPAGSGVVSISSGSSYYVGSVVSVSTDTLTVTPALGAGGASGPIYKAWQGGPTYAINASLYGFDYDFDISESAPPIATDGFWQSATGDFVYQDPYKRFRVWGDQLAIAANNGYPGIAFNGATVGFLQIDGRFSACDFEVSGNGILHGTFSINGVPSWGLNEGMTGVVKKTIFTDGGPGWHSLRFDVGASFGNVNFTKFNFYNLSEDIGVTYGQLASYKDLEDYAERGAINASLMALGTEQRIYANDLYYSGAWGQGVTTGAAGGIQWAGSSTNSTVQFSYFGKDFAVVGANGSSGVLTVDGASIAVTFNVMKTIATEGFHEVVYQHHGGTSVISAVDFTRSKDEIKSLQNYETLNNLENIPEVIQSADTPRNPKPGTIWAQNQNQNQIWVYLFGRWNQLSVFRTADDPNLETLVVYGGRLDASNLTNDTYSFVETWSQVSDLSANRREGNTTSDSAYRNRAFMICGNTSSSSTTTTATNFVWNRTAWASISNSSTTARQSLSGHEFNNLLYVAGGVNTSGTVLSAPEKWNDSSWASFTNPLSVARSRLGSTIIPNQNKIYWFAGTDNAGSANDAAFEMNAAESASSIGTTGSARIDPGAGYLNNIAYRLGGDNSGPQTDTYSYNGAAFSSSVALPASYERQAFSSTQFYIYVVAGVDSSGETTAQQAVYAFNGTSYSTRQNYPVATASFGGSSSV